jgi:hypothetical protein
LEIPASQPELKKRRKELIGEINKVINFIEGQGQQPQSPGAAATTGMEVALINPNATDGNPTNENQNQNQPENPNQNQNSSKTAEPQAQGQDQDQVLVSPPTTSTTAQA